MRWFSLYVRSHFANAINGIPDNSHGCIHSGRLGQSDPLPDEASLLLRVVGERPLRVDHHRRTGVGIVGGPMRDGGVVTQLRKLRPRICIALTRLRGV